MALVDAVERHAESARESEMSLEYQANIVSNSIVMHRLVRGSKCQDWLFTELDMRNRHLTMVSGGGHAHALAMQCTAQSLVRAHRVRVEAGAVKDSDLCHNEKRGRFFSG